MSLGFAFGSADAAEAFAEWARKRRHPGGPLLTVWVHRDEPGEYGTGLSPWPRHRVEVERPGVPMDGATERDDAAARRAEVRIIDAACGKFGGRWLGT